MHHATLYTSATLDKKILPTLLQTGGVDVLELNLDSLGIDDVRHLTEQAYQRPVSQSHREFVCIFKAATREAQNALLKLLEEPPETARFTFLVPHAGLLLPTVLSRMQIQVDTSEQPKVISSNTGSLAEKLESIATAQKKKDISWLQGELSAVVADSSVDPKVRLLIANYKDSKGSSRKMLLELAILFRR